MVVGQGTRLVPDSGADTALELLESRATPSAGASHVRITLREQPPRRVALLSLPLVAVSFEFEDSTRLRRRTSSRTSTRTPAVAAARKEKCPMGKLRVAGFTLSLDGYGAGPRQDLGNPLGVGGEQLHRWLVPTRTFKAFHGGKEGTTGIDDDYARRGTENIGAWIMGRNMFGPIRGDWPDEGWKGWWGDDPPYHVPVFVLTRHPRKAIQMQGNTTFHFVTEGIEEALRRARAAAGSKDIRLGGGVETVRQYLRAGLVDEMHLVISPVLLGSGEHLLSGLDLLALGFRVAEHVASEAATHVVLKCG